MHQHWNMILFNVKAQILNGENKISLATIQKIVKPNQHHDDNQISCIFVFIKAKDTVNAFKGRKIMDIQRAAEIINSAEMINVSFRGIPVYIKEVHSSNQTATVFPLDEMDHVQVVELNGLFEEGPTVLR